MAITSTTEQPARLARRPKRSRQIGPPPGEPMRIANLEVDRLCVRTPGGTGTIWFGFQPNTGYPRIYITDERGDPRVELGAYDGQWAVILRGSGTRGRYGAPRAALVVFETSGSASAMVYDGEGHPANWITARETTAREAAKAAEIAAAKQASRR